jgi:hypothetical protein
VSSGYNVLFAAVLDGTLFGRWPHTGVWTCLLSQADRHGIIDQHPNLLRAKIGCTIEELLACINDFMAPDPGSRTGDMEGRRLELMDPSREWGWRVINHGIYREKARKLSYDARRTASGEDAERKRKNSTPAKSRRVPRSPAISPAVPLSDAEAEANCKRGPRTSRVPESFSPDLAYAKTQIPDIDAEAEAKKFRDWEFKTPRSDWAACWRTWIAKAKESSQYAKAGGGHRWQ